VTGQPRDGRDADEDDAGCVRSSSGIACVVKADGQKLLDIAAGVEKQKCAGRAGVVGGG
jgi:hypothetical protein